MGSRKSVSDSAWEGLASFSPARGSRIASISSLPNSSGADLPSGDPHIPQNWCMGGLSCPQVGHARRSLRARSVAALFTVTAGARFCTVGAACDAEAACSELCASRSRSSSSTASSRFSGALVKYTSAQRPMFSARSGFSRGLSSGRGRVRAPSELSVELANQDSPQPALDESEEFGRYDCTPIPGGCQF